MAQNTTPIALSTYKNPWLKLLLLTGLVFMGASVGHWAIRALNWPYAEVAQPITGHVHSYKKFLLITQATIASSAFIGAPMFYWRFIEHKQVRLLFQWRQGYAYPILLTLGLVFSCMLVNTLLIQWNLSVRLPAFLADFENWAQNKEAELKRLTELLTTFYNTTDFLSGIVVIAFIPAIGEELLFRGIVQSLFYQITKSTHLAIYIAALIFSAIHSQFYGLLPRFLLGVLFGYIYEWTKDLAFPTIAHFFNNSFTLFMLFLHQQGSIKQDVQTTQALPLPVITLFTVISLALASTLQRHSRRKFS
ncbi:MAG: CPBP family intramembrane glutamic endopeptidase [Bacteroidota bacterium]